ncbi:DMT family transporter [Salicola sp. Rm-C-2C1-2]|uniref:DMT family transporter n=1 Tax=Salicola sp. Rm-C-2C1-2 TaxID=3141321 RepID=UPI0032E4E9DB
MAVSTTAKSDLLFVAAALLAAISWMFSREAVLAMPPLLFLSLRFLLAGSVLAAFGWHHFKGLTREQFLRAARVGVVFGAGMSCWVTGLHLTSHIGEGAFIISLNVVFVPVIARLVFAEEQPITTWLALPVAMAGLALLSLNGGFDPEAGQVFFLLAALILAFYFTLNARAANTHPAGRKTHRAALPVYPLTTIALSMVGTVTLVLSLVLEPWAPTFSDFGGDLVLWIVLSAIVGTAARFFVQTWAQSLAAHSHGVVILSMEPVWVAFFAVGWFGETMVFQQFAGCALILTALFVNRWHTVRSLIRDLRGN